MAILQITNAKLTKIGLAVATSAMLLSWGSAAQSQSGCADPTSNSDWSAPINNPAPEDRQAAMDLIHQFFFALDEENTDQIPRFFTDNATYELCSGGGAQQVKKPLGPSQIETHFKDEFFILGNQGSRVHHFAGNTLLHVGPNVRDRIEVKSAVLAVIQRSDLEVPALDYVAVMKAVLVRDKDNTWKFSVLTLVTDEPEITARAR